MNEFLVPIFFVCVFLIVNSYVFYPLIIFLISLFYKDNESIQNDYEAPVSILISAYNEEKVIKNRIENLLNQNYDNSKLEILVGSDCSTDKTNSILENLSKSINNLRVFIFNYRQGKAGVLNKLAKQASNEILIFTDANTEFEKNSIKKIVRHFQNNNVGGVSGRLILIDEDKCLTKGVEEKKYWIYETFIKIQEGKLGILIGANGGIFAIRKNLFEAIPVDKPVTDDFFVSLMVIKQGYKFKYEKEAIAIEEISTDLKIEFKRKVRIAATNYQTIYFFRDLLFNKNLLITYAIWSHKILRWFIPFILFFLLIINLFLIGYNEFFKWTFWTQIIFYISGIIGYILIKLKIRIKILSLITYFISTNLALIIGFIKFLKRKHSVIWESTPR